MKFNLFKQLFQNKEATPTELFDKKIYMKDHNARPLALLDAMIMIDKGYEPTSKQKEQLDTRLQEASLLNMNFLPYFSEVIHLIADSLFINYLMNRNINTLSSLNKDKWLVCVKEMETRTGLSQNINDAMLNHIEMSTSEFMKLKPVDYVFCFNQEQKKIHQQLLNCYSNFNLLLPHLVNNKQEFIEIKDRLIQSQTKLYDYIYHANNGAGFDAIESGQENFQRFQMGDILAYMKNIEKLDTSKIEQKFKRDTSNNDTKPLEELLQLLDKDITNIIQDIIKDYPIALIQAKKNFEDTEIKLLLKDSVQVIKNYLSLSLEERSQLKNSKGQNPYDLLVDSLSIVKGKFKELNENFMEEKMIPISIQHAKMKMKA